MYWAIFAIKQWTCAGYILHIKLATTFEFPVLSLTFISMLYFHGIHSGKCDRQEIEDGEDNGSPLSIMCHKDL